MFTDSELIKPLSAALLVLGLVALLAGCGHGGSEGRETGEAAQMPVQEARVMPLRAQPPRRPGESVCTDGSAHLGAGGSLAFQTRCAAPARGGQVTVAVVPYVPAHPGVSVPIVGYTIAPKVVGHGEGAGPGKCVTHGASLTCTARIDSPVDIEGEMRVKVHGRCSVGVSLVSVTSAPCARKFCESSPILHQLFRGRPGGCQ
jgi:hypothetical protein